MLATGVAGFLYEIWSGKSDPVIVVACLTWAGVPAALAVFQGKVASTLTGITNFSAGEQPPSSPSASSSLSAGDRST
jgi:hypothetical protein